MSDNECWIALKNCYEAVPDHGKVILVEILAAVEPGTDQRSKYIAILELNIMAYISGSRQMIIYDFEKLANKQDSPDLRKFALFGILVLWSYSLWILSSTVGLSMENIMHGLEWLKRMDQYSSAIKPKMETTYGKDSAVKWIPYWRTFFISVAELFGCNNSEEWMVAHFLFKKFLSVYAGQNEKSEASCRIFAQCCQGCSNTALLLRTSVKSSDAEFGSLSTYKGQETSYFQSHCESSAS